MSKKPTQEKLHKHQTEKPVSRGRHEKNCTVCNHPQREQIESEFVNWTSVEVIATAHSISRDSLYRHAHAFNLMNRRGRNLKVALSKIIERAGDVEVNGSAVVAAVIAYAKLNSRGQIVERIENVDLNALFEKMSTAELEEYAKTGHLPLWFSAVAGATEIDSEENLNG